MSVAAVLRGKPDRLIGLDETRSLAREMNEFGAKMTSDYLGLTGEAVQPYTTSDPREAPELLLLRERMRDWRFYDHFRTDIDAPARRRH